MIIIEAIMLTGIILLGGYCTYTDLQRGIVPNKTILIGLLLGVALHVSYLICGAAPYYLYWLYNMLIADIIAFMMYLGRMWAAGDAKMFMLLFFLTPARLLDSGTLSHSIVPYIFIFVPALLWMIGDSFIRIIRREPRKQGSFSVKSFFTGILSIVIETTAFHCLSSWLYPDLIIQQAFFFAALMLAYAYMCGTLPIMRRWYVVTIHALVVFIMWLHKQCFFEVPSWQNYLIIVSVFVIQRFCSLYNYQLIATSQVKTGMIPAGETVIMFQTSKVHSLPGDPSEELTAKISEEEAMAVRRWEKSSQGKPYIWIVRKAPFAIMIYFGFVGWILLRILGR